MYPHPAWDTIFQRKAPLAKLLDLRFDDVNATVFTFTACQIENAGNGYESPYIYGSQPHVRSRSTNALFVIVHGEDSVATFSVSSVTIGGVAAVEQVDRGGVSNAINTAIYRAVPGTLNDITNTDIVVTWDEAINCCAIGVVSVENIGLVNNLGNASSTATGTMTPGPITGSITASESHAFCLIGMTVLLQGEQAVSWSGIDDASATGGQVQHMLLYDLPTAEMSCAAFWTYWPAYPAGNNIFRVSAAWIGSTGGDTVISAYL